MRSILKIEKVKILNTKFKKFKNLKKIHNVNKLKLSSLFVSTYKEKEDLCERVFLLETLCGETFIVNKFKFYNNNKKHVRLGVLIFFKINVFKKKIFPCLSYFFVYQLFLYYEFFLKVKSFSFNDYSNYLWAKPVVTKSSFSTSFDFFMCWSDLNSMFLFPFFEQWDEVLDVENTAPEEYVQRMQIDFVIFYKFSKIFFKILNVIKKNIVKLFVFFYKKFFFKFVLKNSKSKKLKLLLAKKYIFFKTNVKT